MDAVALIVTGYDIRRAERPLKLRASLQDLGYAAHIVHVAEQGHPLAHRIRLAAALIAHSAGFASVENAARIYPGYRALVAAGRGHERADLVISHGWQALAPAAALARRFGARLIHDAVEGRRWEFSRSSVTGSALGRFSEAMEARFLRDCAAVMSPSPGFLKMRTDELPPGTPSAVIANAAPAGVLADAPVPARDIVSVAYQGLALGNRDLGPLIANATANWPKGTRLDLMLAGPHRLDRTRPGARTGATLAFHPPAPADAQVSALIDLGAAIGLCVFDPADMQLRLADPNKLYNYMAAGMAVLATAGTRSGEVVAEAGAGIVLDDHRPETVRRAVASLVEDPASLAQYRSNALAFARAHAWESQTGTLAGLLEAVGLPVSRSAPEPTAYGAASPAHPPADT
ncbi:MAG: hypothetical protein KDJ77_16190 [Rhodobiaceae bacterium]|nr:hypothetical protein [Rhodobiaceae bacterium]